jgi:hypothetical protein
MIAARAAFDKSSLGTLLRDGRGAEGPEGARAWARGDGQAGTGRRGRRRTGLQGEISADCAQGAAGFSGDGRARAPGSLGAREGGVAAGQHPAELRQTNRQVHVPRRPCGCVPDLSGSSPCSQLAAAAHRDRACEPLRSHTLRGPGSSATAPPWKVDIVTKLSPHPGGQGRACDLRRSGLQVGVHETGRLVLGTGHQMPIPVQGDADVRMPHKR